ncbi:ribonuclease HII [Bacillus pumilus]|uniref:Ribonuclease HII n=1 Tax=Bacillus pumilus TaxID=1408 RepID=A0A2A5IWL2_BACPU|nr:ribonuclease HII [Bacillus pumilus]PCK21643.1 ribonuclease HII [Bacillus pumilus]
MYTVKQMKELIEEHAHDESYIRELVKDDTRKSVQKLIEKWRKEREKQQELHAAWNRMLQFEHQAKAQGYTCIAGIDEAGRGPLAGPVVAAAVILKEETVLLGLNDSKQLSEKKRLVYYDLIQEEALDVGIGIVDAATIDEINIYEASRLAMMRAVEQLTHIPDYLLIDAMTLPLPTHQENIIKGDAKSASIAAGACIAKVTRDQMMEEYGRQYPEYQFEKHKGYGTKEHLTAIQKHGATPIHRLSFAPVKSVIS